MTPAMLWLRQLARRWQGGQEDRCATHTGAHLTIQAHTRELGWLEVYDHERYDGTAGYCAGNDNVSLALDRNHTWEEFGTVLALDALRGYRPGEVVLDFGAHIGWYALQAARRKYPTLAVDADAENLALLGRNAALMDVAHRIVVCRGWVGPAAEPVTMPPAGVRVRLLKADLESREDDLVRITGPLFEARLVDHALVEVSPVFADHYPDTVGRVMDCGYRAAFVPIVRGEAPEPIGRAEMADKIRAVRQRDVLFTRQ